MRVKTIRGVADLFGVSQRSIWLWLDKGMPYASEGSRANGEDKQASEWEFDSKDCIEWYAAAKAAGAFKPGPKKAPVKDGDEMSQVEFEKASAERDMAVIKAASMKGSVVPIEDVFMLVSSEYGTIRRRIRQLKNTTAGKLVGLPEKEIKNILEEEIEKVLNELAADDQYRSVDQCEDADEGIGGGEGDDAQAAAADSD